MTGERDATEDALRDAAHDAFMVFWRSEACEQAELWAAYYAAQACYEAYLMPARWHSQPWMARTANSTLAAGHHHPARPAHE